MQITILTIFPEYFTSILENSMIKKAQEKGIVSFSVLSLRDFAQDKHKITDDRPFGGGPGMVLKVEPIDLALQSIGVTRDSQDTKIILTSAKGTQFTQAIAREYAKLQHMVIICGHYEGVDERVAEHLVSDEVRVGDYVLTGGEPATAVLLDAVTRLVPGVLGNEASTQDESHEVAGVFGHPTYTRPEVYKAWKVPDVLLSGDHQAIATWRKSQKKKVDS